MCLKRNSFSLERPEQKRGMIMNNIMRNVLMRRSIYSFDSHPVRDEDLLEILEEGKALSNAEDNQAWHFTVLQNKRLLEEIRNILRDKLNKDVSGLLAEAPPVIIVISSCADADYAFDAANMVFASMMLVAEKKGLGACWLNAATELFKSESGKKFIQKIGIPVDYVPLCIGAFGYKPVKGGSETMLPNDNVINIVK